MMLPRRIATRLKLIAGLTVFAIALPAFTGFDRTGDHEARREEEAASWAKIHIPFSLEAWRTRVGAAQEAIRVLVDGSPNKIEPAHPPQEPLFGANEDFSPVAAYAPNDNWLKGGATPDSQRATIAALIGDDGETFAAALSAFRNGDFAAGDAAAAKLKSRLPETAARWVGIKLHPKQAGFARIAAFLEQHPGWPGAEWARRHAEEYLIGERHPTLAAREFFARAAPLTGYGKYALARLRAQEGAFEEASALARDAWREDDLSGVEAAFHRELGALLTPADHKFRSDRLFYASKYQMAMKSADLAGPEFAAQARARLTGAASSAPTNDPFTL
ncbi:MAG: lytic transglycosylase domain-containing protein, partial [Methylocystis sp.]|nr:lytic transglycosylase domain-containing protein [Methylocystis sp.]